MKCEINPMEFLSNQILWLWRDSDLWLFKLNLRSSSSLPAMIRLATELSYDWLFWTIICCLSCLIFSFTTLVSSANMFLAPVWIPYVSKIFLWTLGFGHLLGRPRLSRLSSDDWLWWSRLSDRWHMLLTDIPLALRFLIIRTLLISRKGTQSGFSGIRIGPSWSGWKFKS